MRNAKGLVEALLFAAGEPVEQADLIAWAGVSEEELAGILSSLEAGREAGAGLVLRRVGSKVQLVTNPRYGPRLREVFAPAQQVSLSSSLMETLAVVAYRQPVTRPEIEQIRGVRCAYALAGLLERGLIRKAGTKEVVGRPSLYATTDEFLMRFGFESLDALPPLSDETCVMADLEQKQSQGVPPASGHTGEEQT